MGRKESNQTNNHVIMPIHIMSQLIFNWCLSHTLAVKALRNQFKCAVWLVFAGPISFIFRDPVQNLGALGDLAPVSLFP